MLYVYDVDIIDSCNGMTLIEDYIWLCESKILYDHKNNTHSRFDYLEPREIKTFLVKCFMSIYTTERHFEGKPVTIAISAIPRFAGYLPFRIVYVRECNNGQSWIVSECLLDNYDLENGNIQRLSPRKNLDSISLIDILNDSYDLAEKIYARALNDSLDKIEPVPIISSQQYTVGTQLCNEQVKFDKFNMTNYERVR